jgi:hypothetical protein
MTRKIIDFRVTGVHNVLLIEEHHGDKRIYAVEVWTNMQNPPLTFLVARDQTYSINRAKEGFNEQLNACRARRVLNG